jgi:hypothetical protein
MWRKLYASRLAQSQEKEGGNKEDSVSRRLLLSLYLESMVLSLLKSPPAPKEGAGPKLIIQVFLFLLTIPPTDTTFLVL